MKVKKNVSYFPVSSAEQALLLRAREPDLSDRLDDLIEMLDQIAAEKLSSADLEQAIQLLRASREGEDLAARFDNLEARLKERMERGLTEIEGRLSQRLSGEPGPTKEAPRPSAPEPVTPTPAAPSPVVPPPTGELPREASIAFRIGKELVWGESAAQFYAATWRWLFDHGYVRKADLPIQSGKSRYVLAATPVHPSEREFFAPHELMPGVWLEAHLSRADIIRRAKKHLSERGVEFEVVIGSD